MERCPTCRAKTGGKRSCRRCGTDLGRLADLAAEAAAHLEKAREAWAREDYEGMYRHARRACALRRTPCSARMLACGALLSGRFPFALDLWRRGCEPGGPASEERTASTDPPPL